MLLDFRRQMNRVFEIGLIILISIFLVQCEKKDPINQVPEPEIFPSFNRSLALEPYATTSANVTFGDLNGDGNLDIVLAKGRHWPVINRIIFGDGKGNIIESKDLGTIENRSYTSLLSDLDQDGDLDIVVSNDDPDSKLIYLNDGSGNFELNSEFGSSNWSTRNASIADLNNDGYPDIVVANRNSRSATTNYYCINNGEGNFENNSFAFANYSATTITPGDFNNDGLIDLAVPHRDGGQSYVHMQTSSDSINFKLLPFGPADASIRMSKVADLNQNGKLDIIAIDTKKGAVVYFQQTDGSFSSGTSIGSQTQNPYALAVGDLNLDGHTDIIVGYINFKSVVLYNDGTGNNYTSVEFGGNDQGTVYGFDIGDFDKDGLIDIAAARSGAVNILYFGEVLENP